MSGNELLVKVVVPDLLDQLSEDLRQELIDKQYICLSKLGSNSDELKDEIKRLKSDLIFANKCLNTLNKFKKYLNEIRFKFESLLDSKERLELNSLEIEYNLMIQKIKDRKRLTDGTDCLNNAETDEEDYAMAVDDDINDHSDYDPKVDKSAESSSDEELVEEKPKLDKIKVKSNAENNKNSINSKNLVFKYKCEDCYYRTNYDNLWQNHKNSHLEGFGREREELFCEVCDKRFPNSRAMIIHFHFNHPGYRYGFRQVECLFPGCDVTFVKRSAKYRQHLRRHFIENNSEPFICGLVNCQFSSEDYNLLKRHQFRAHSAPEERKHMCEQPGCGQRFYYLDCLRSHFRTVHRSKSFWCNLCPKMYKHKQDLFNHLTKKHEVNADIYDMDQYLCDDQNLRPMKRFFCYECQIQFRDNMILERHKKKEHPIGNKTATDIDVKIEDTNGSASADVIFSEEFINEVEVMDETVAENDKIILTEDVFEQSVSQSIDIPVTETKGTVRLIINESVDKIPDSVLESGQIESTSVIFDSHQKISQYSKIGEYVCKECQFQEFQSLREFDKHNREVHNRDDRDIECQFPGCSTLLDYSCKGLQRHMERHLLSLQVDYFTCDLNCCDFRSKVYNDLLRHQIKVHNKYIVSYECQVTGCERVFTSSIKFNNHKKSHSNSRIFYCNYDNCDHFCRTKELLDKHKRIHTDPKPIFNCVYDNCPFESYDGLQIKAHLNEHPIKNTSQRPYACSFCTRKFKSKDTAVQHIRLHSDIKDFKCKYQGCVESFQTSAQRAKHVNSVHKKIVKMYPCDWPECTYIGKSNHNLKHHKYRHTGELPYPCNWPECGKRFRSESTYSTHMRLHKNDRRYKCVWPGCEFDTHDRGAIRFHKMRHQRQLEATDKPKPKPKPKRPSKVVFKAALPKRRLVKRTVKKPKRFESDSDSSDSN